MFRSYLALFLLFAGFMCVPQTGNAFWWLFGNDDEWRKMEPAEQDRLALPNYEKGVQAQRAGKLRSALRHYKKVWEDYPGSQYAPEALFRTARIQKERKKWRKAIDAYQRMIRFYPESPRFNEIILDQFEVASAFEVGDGIRFLKIFPSTSPERAIAAYERVVSNAPYSEYAPAALMRIAMIYRRMGDEVYAIDALDRLINNYPRSMLASDAYLMLADTFADEVKGPRYDQGATREAMSYYRDFLILFPNNPAIYAGEQGLAEMREVYARSKLVLGEFYYDYRDDYTAAEVFFNEAITTAPESDAAAKAREYIGRIEGIKARYPSGNWPRRTEWDYIFFWNRWFGLGKGEQVDPETAAATDPSLITPEEARITEGNLADPTPPAGATTDRVEGQN